MISRSYTNLLDLTAGYNSLNLPNVSRSLPKVMTMAGALSDFRDDESTCAQPPDTPPAIPGERTIIVANMLPLQAKRDHNGDSWSFTWDDNSLLLHIRDGLLKKTELLYVGCLAVDVDITEQDDLAVSLLEKFNCLPVFIPPDLKHKYFNCFCKHYMWPLFHYMLPITPELGARFDRTLWQAYVSVNKMFADKVVEILNPEDDYVWVHDYHLMAFPTFLRKRFCKAKLGFFLHTPFPTSEIYRTLPVREEILQGLLNADLIGFHTFDYARHFLSCCSRMLGLQFKSQRGYISLDYFGRNVGIKIMPAGIHMGRLIGNMKVQETQMKQSQLKAQFADKTIILGVDDLDVFQGISLKLLAIEELLVQHPEWKGKLVLVQIANPTNNHQDDFEVKEEIHEIVKRINGNFGSEGYEPVILVQRPVSVYERIAYYSIAECCVVTAVRDGLNLIPYEYTVCRQGIEGMDARKQSALVVSEFIGCSPSLSGAIRVNPWNIASVAEAMHDALTMAESEKQMRHEKHYKYVSTHDIAYWVRSFMSELEKTCKDHAQHRYWGIGFGFGFRVVALDPSFRKLSIEHISSAYKRTANRVILLDYDGTMMPCNSIDKTPSPQILSLLNVLCQDPCNMVFMVSGRGRDILNDWFSPCTQLGISAEHGYFKRWPGEAEWETSIQASDFSWKEIVEPILKRYTERTDGSYIEVKESALVWHYQDADPDFGSWQAKELLDHLKTILASKPVVVKSGLQIVEVKPQGVNKGVVADELLQSLVVKGNLPGFLLCVGDDRSDEDMFESILNTVGSSSRLSTAEVFACTVGQKPSKAKYFLEDTVEVVKMLQCLASVSELQIMNESSSN